MTREETAPVPADVAVTAPSPGRRERLSGTAIDPADLARLNSTLRADISFDVKQSCCGDSTAAAPDSFASRNVVRLRGPAAMGVLVHTAANGGSKSASCPVVCSQARRQLLHSLAGSLAECAMTLGLGAGVYHGHRGGAAPRGGESP